VINIYEHRKAYGPTSLVTSKVDALSVGLRPA
jgi:hypothetical protein